MNVLLSLGSNVDPEANLPRAVLALHAVGAVRRWSPAYRSPPAGGAPGPPFLNAAVQLATDLPPGPLKTRLRALESRLGRQRPAPPDAPRPIDVDVVWADGAPPHPDVLAFPHVARPLADIAPDRVHPATGETLAAVAARLGGGGLAHDAAVSAAVAAAASSSADS